MKITGCFAKYHKSLLPLAVALPLLAVLILSVPALAAPVVTLTPTTGVPGTTVTVSGTVFDSYKGDNVYIFFDDMEIDNSPIEIPDTGTFTTHFIVPTGSEPGRHWVRVRSEAGSTSFLAENFFIIEEAEIELDVLDGPVGTEVTISGSGFHAGRTVTIYYYNIIREKLGTEVASPAGEFSYHFTIPTSTAGKHRIAAENAEGDSAETEFEVIPEIMLNLASGSPGDLLTVSGTGFGYRSQVNIHFGIYTVATLSTDEYGNFDVEFNIPQVNSAIYDVKALDELGNLDKTQFTTTAGASLNQSTGSVGSTLTVRGTGFEAGQTVTVEYDNLSIATATADNNGAFTATFDVPLSTGGDHIITISDGTSTRMFAFAVESEAPPVPDLLLPSDSSETSSQAYLDWRDVTDPSLPVAYNLQVASDRNFSTLVLEKEGLTDSEYSLTEAERLAATAKQALYFWRVKAIDSASNESEWSAPWSFYISAPPPPALLHPASDGPSETPIFFYWQDVTSLSPPITYTLQITTDLNFTSIVLEKLGMADSEYLLFEEAELELFKKAEPYYWRVKATDSANNESEWSPPASFYLDSSFSFPGWATYTLISIGVIIVGFIAFRVGRQTAFNPPD